MLTHNYKVVTYKRLKYEIISRLNRLTNKEFDKLILDVVSKYTNEDSIAAVYVSEDVLIEPEEAEIANVFYQIYNEYDFDYIDFN